MWGSIIKESDKSGIPRIQDIRRRANHSRITQRSYANESITCAIVSQRVLKQRLLNVKIRDSKSLQRNLRTTQAGFTVTVAMKSTSLRFKASVLTNVSLHWHHPSAELRNQLSVTHHKLATTPSCFQKENIQRRKQLQNEVQLQVHHCENLETFSGSAQFSLSDDFFTSWEHRSYSDSPWFWMTNKATSRGSSCWQIAATSISQKRKTSNKNEVSHSSQYPRASMLWIGETEDA